MQDKYRDKDKKKSSKKSTKMSGRDYHTLLNKVEARERKVQKLSEKDPEKAEKFTTSVKWRDAMERAEGKTVKVTCLPNWQLPFCRTMRHCCAAR